MFKVLPGADTPGDRDLWAPPRAPTSNTWLAVHFPVQGRRGTTTATWQPSLLLETSLDAPFSLSTGVLSALLELEADFSGRGQDGLEVQDLTANPRDPRTPLTSTQAVTHHPLLTQSKERNVNFF